MRAPLVAAACFLMMAACHRAKEPTVVRVTNVLLQEQYDDGRIVPRPGFVFMVVRVVRTPGVEKDDGMYDWFHTLAYDAKGTAYTMTYLRGEYGASGTSGGFWPRTHKVHPSVTNMVYEVPAGTVLKRIELRQTRSLPPAIRVR
jgi:hypothetical protein